MSAFKRHKTLSSQSIEEAQEDESTKKVATALGIPYDELDSQEWSIEAATSNDDMIYGYNIYLENGRVAYLTPDQVE